MCSKKCVPQLKTRRNITQSVSQKQFCLDYSQMFGFQNLMERKDKVERKEGRKGCSSTLKNPFTLTTTDVEVLAG